MTCSGQTSNFAFTPARSMTLPLMVLMSVTPSSTSCAMSLSPVDTRTCSPWARAVRVSVPMTSSASTPLIRSKGKPRPCTASSNGSTCARSSSGMGGRCALYCSNKASRKVGPEASNTTAMRAGCSSFRNFSSMFSTPYTAPVGSPREFDSGGSAWKARYRYDDPSTRYSVWSLLVWLDSMEFSAAAADWWAQSSASRPEPKRAFRLARAPVPHE